jgi:hypothetical protein
MPRTDERAAPRAEPTSETADDPRLHGVAYRVAPPLPRRFVCHACRAPNRCPYEGGSVRCASCGRTRDLPPRDAPPARALTDREEVARMAAIALQSPAPPPTPPALASVVEGDAVIARGKEQEAVDLWFTLRAQASTDVAAAEPLFALTRLLFSHPFLDDRPELREALVDDALDALTLPRHRTVLTAMRVRQAAGRGDADSARMYFQALNLTPTDRQSDTHVRIAIAMLAIAEHRWSDVLAALGFRRDERPLDDEFVDLAVVLRAHALERLGDAAGAHAALDELRHPSVARLARERSPALDLCRDSWRAYLARARTQKADLLARRERSAAWGGALLVGIAAVVAVGGANVAALGVAAGLALLGLAVAIASLRDAALTRRAYLEGALCDARVLGARRVAFRGAPAAVGTFEFDLEIAGPRGPYLASLRMPSTDDDARRFVGRSVRVRVHPERPDFVVYEDDLAARQDDRTT